MKGRQPSFDVDREQSNPQWGDPSWRSIPADVSPADIASAHLHINHEDIRADPEIALPTRLLAELVAEGQVGSATTEHFSLMGYQDRSLEGWQKETAPTLIARLRDLQADGIILAPA